MAERPLLPTDTDKWRLARDPLVPWPFEHTPHIPSACPMCGGAGSVLESIDPERFPVAVPCDRCRRWCDQCKKHVARAGHQCKGDPNGSKG
jgi:hypothetical protein